jgi:glycosyltransferase involved in cell wall biosynthesis
VLFPNSSLAREYASRWLDGRDIAEPVYPGVDAQQMGGADGQIGLRDRATLLYVGRLAPAKNVDLLLKAWLRLDPRPELHLCGEGPEEKRLRALVEGQEGVRFHGFLPDSELWRLFARSDLVVVPSSFEGFGMPPMQALYFGKPCLASDIPVFRSVYGDKLEYFRNGDLDDLLRQIQALLADPQYRARRGEAGRQFVIERFTWDRAAETIERSLTRAARG